MALGMIYYWVCHIHVYHLVIYNWVYICLHYSSHSYVWAICFT